MILYSIQFTLSLLFLLVVYKLVVFRFHWFTLNRFYLVIIPFLLFLSPLVLDFSLITPVEISPKLTSVTENIFIEEEALGSKREIVSHSSFNYIRLTLGLILIVSSFNLLMIFLKLGRLWYEYKQTPLIGKYRIKEDADRSPFSFFNYIVVPTLKDTEILEHEKVHVHQWHSIDVLGVEFLKSIFWFHPLMYWWAKEVRLNHELLADRGAIEVVGVENYGRVFLQHITPNPYNSVTNSFAYKDFKQRISNFKIQTITMNQKLLVGLIVSSTLALGIVLSGFKYQPIKQYTLVIDAGHGGQDPGAVVDGISEKTVVYNLARIIEEQSKYTSVKVVLLREGDEFITLSDRKNKINALSPDAYISLHANQSSLVEKRGVEVYTGSETANGFANNLAQHISNELNVDVAKTKTVNFVILKNMSIPGALLEIGFLTNAKDRENLLDEDYLEDFAQAILKSIEDPFQEEE